MGFMNMLGGLLQQFQGGQASPEQAERHFDTVAQSAPPGALASSLADAFRSDQTPAFGQLAGQLFGNSNSDQKAGMLNSLLAAAGPALMSGGAGALLGRLAGGGQRPLTPAEAEQVSPDVVNQLATHAEKHDPSIVDQMSGFYAQHTTLVKTLGGAVLAVALTKLANRTNNLG
jgi:hypothetical protein